MGLFQRRSRVEHPARSLRLIHAALPTNAELVSLDLGAENPALNRVVVVGTRPHHSSQLRQRLRALFASAQDPSRPLLVHLHSVSFAAPVPPALSGCRALWLLTK